ncbi:hypothetical protein FAES_0398 [Fibrella aestuarina BUZ 2]|uniref:Uncharacterized protein n=1 Tax=Fibrella aestuarina BUZ 2 TaxID=1166018 RepID=I0K2Q7_9BACT|nr:hypothetical protein FAES_0398 [Fibrella aestuarina BUZ 2]
MPVGRWTLYRSRLGTLSGATYPALTSLSYSSG